MAGLGVIFAAVLAFADKKLRVEEDPRVGEVLKHLPHVNCGACGFPNCHEMAVHIITDGEDPAKCRPLGEEAREELYKLLGRDGGDTYPKVALVHCAAEGDNKKPVADYKGINNCRAANLAFGAGMECEYGCMGLNDCVEACPFGAIRIENGLAKVDYAKCTGCGKCVEACPRNIISLQEKKFTKLFYVACSTHDGAQRVRKICGVGCIACGICEKLSPEKYFVVKDDLSKPDYGKQGKVEEVAKLKDKCPTKVIKEI